jgi:hypothetical protein
MNPIRKLNFMAFITKNSLKGRAFSKKNQIRSLF